MTKSGTTGIDEATGPLDDVEGIMAGLRPVEPSADLFARMLAAVEAGRAEVVEEDVPVPVGEISPVTVPEDKLNRWTRLMDEAAREATEERLKDLKANQPADFKLMRWLMSVENTSSEPAATAPRREVSIRRPFRLWALSAAAFAMVLGVLGLYSTDSGANGGVVQKGGMNRETLNVVAEGINWNAEKGVAEKNYRVDYLDKLEMVDHKGMQMEVAVPSSRTVAVPVEIY